MNEREKKILEGLSSMLGVSELSQTIIESAEVDYAKKEKERRMLKAFEASLAKIQNRTLEISEAIDDEPPTIVEETVAEASFVKAALDNAKTVTEPVFQGVEPQPELPEKDFVTKAVETISKTEKDKPKPAATDIRSEVDLLKKHVLDLHHFASRISQHAGGGGAGDVISLDHPAKTIYANYTFTHKDYYVGAGVTPVTITLPSVAKNGRYIIIKDEVGNCSANPITILGNVDNDAGGLILAQNNGGIQMLYNNGSWRIV